MKPRSGSWERTDEIGISISAWMSMQVSFVVLSERDVDLPGDIIGSRHVGRITSDVPGIGIFYYLD
jgi:hypothetical protein